MPSLISHNRLNTVAGIRISFLILYIIFLYDMRNLISVINGDASLLVENYSDNSSVDYQYDHMSDILK